MSVPACVCAHVCIRMCVYPCECFCVFQTACRQSRACPVQTAVIVPFVETKPQGNTMGPPAVTAVKASSDAPYARATSTPAGTDSKSRASTHTCTQNHKIMPHLDHIYGNYGTHSLNMHGCVHTVNMFLCTFPIMCRYLNGILKLLIIDFSAQSSSRGMSH